MPKEKAFWSFYWLNTYTVGISIQRAVEVFEAWEHHVVANFSNKAKKGWPNPTLVQFSRFIANTGLELASAGCWVNILQSYALPAD